MNKITNLLLTGLSICLLAGCGGNTSSDSVNSGVSTSDSSGGSSDISLIGDNTVILVLGPTGLYNGEKQGDVNIYENAFEYTAAVSSLLPGSDVITSTSAGYTFETWVSYEGDGTPTRFEHMPSEGYKVLHAWFKNSGDSSTSEIPPIGEKKTIYLNPGIWNADSPKYYAWIWRGSDAGSWIDFTSEGTLYKIEIAETYTNIIFLRAGQSMEHGWIYNTNYWNRTGDETLDFSKTVFKVTEWSGGGSEGKDSIGTWSAKS